MIMNNINSNTWFTSDNHWGHENIIKYCKRPFLGVTEMDEAMIKNWNSVVQPNDTIYHIGDVSFYRDHTKTANILRRLNGRKIIILGNHDVDRDGVPHPVFKEFFEQVHSFGLEIKIEKQRIILCHYAMKVWNRSHRESWQLYGHSHGTIPDPIDALQLDVGVDCHNYTPISFQQVKRLMSKKQFVPIDHHGAT